MSKKFRNILSIIFFVLFAGLFVSSFFFDFSQSMENLRTILSALFLFATVAVKRSPEDRNNIYNFSTVAISFLLIVNFVIYLIYPLFNEKLFLASFGFAAVYAIVFDWKSFMFPERKSAQS